MTIDHVGDPDSGYIRLVYHRFDKQKDEIHEGHQHDQDHVTLLIAGSVRIEWKNANGGGARIMQAPCHFWVRADTEHTLTALQDGTIWLCVFLPTAGYEDDLKPFWNETLLYA